MKYHQRMGKLPLKKRVNRDKTVYVWGLRYRWDPSLSMNPVRRFAHFMSPWRTRRKTYSSPSEQTPYLLLWNSVTDFSRTVLARSSKPQTNMLPYTKGWNVFPRQRDSKTCVGMGEEFLSGCPTKKCLAKRLGIRSPMAQSLFGIQRSILRINQAPRKGRRIDVSDGTQVHLLPKWHTRHQ